MAQLILQRQAAGSSTTGSSIAGSSSAAAGSLTAIDRSPVAIERAAQRCADEVAAGKARFLKQALAEADFPEALFDRALAVNVNLFWLEPAAELRVLAKILKPGGRLCLVYQPPDAKKAAQIAGASRVFLHAHGFGDLETRFADLGREVGAAVLARRKTEIPAAPRLMDMA